MPALARLRVWHVGARVVAAHKTAAAAASAAARPPAMEFPAARTPEWLRAAFDGPTEQQQQHKQQEQQQQQQSGAAAGGLLTCPPFIFKDLDVTPRLLLETPSATEATPVPRRRRRSSSSSSSSSSLYEERAAAVKRSIREALFRQALFQIQNVEVQTLAACGAPRVLAGGAVLFDRKQQQQQQQQAAAAAEGSEAGLLSKLKATAKGLMNPSSSSRSSSSLLELLRVEEWQVERCGSMRLYEVSVHRDEFDFFSLSLKPRSFADRLRQWWFKVADTNED
ncbi:hypothetical protein Efla_005075 [Eimeria flavescens]